MTIVAIETPENRSLPGMLVPPLRAALLRLDRMKEALEGVKRALRLFKVMIASPAINLGAGGGRA